MNALQRSLGNSLENDPGCWVREMQWASEEGVIPVPQKSRVIFIAVKPSSRVNSPHETECLRPLERRKINRHHPNW